MKMKTFSLVKSIPLIFFLIIFSSQSFANTPVKSEISVADKEAILELILNQAELEQYLHAELPNRLPIIFKNNHYVDQQIDISKFNQKVLFLENVPKDTPYFEIISFEGHSKKVSIDLIYPIEGLHISVGLNKLNTGWSMTKFNLVEQ